MPQLPTLTVTDPDTWARLFEAFDGDPAKYKAWLREALASCLLDYEVNSQATTRRADIANRMKNYVV